MDCERKAWRSEVLVPLNHAEGRLPWGSPVLGTMYPVSAREASVGRGEAV